MAVATILSPANKATVFKREIAAENLFHVVVTNAQNFRHEPAEQADHQSAGNGLNPLRGSWKTHEERAQFEQELHEAHRSESAHHAEDGVDAKLHGMHQTIGGNVEQRLIA